MQKICRLFPESHESIRYTTENLWHMPDEYEDEDEYSQYQQQFEQTSTNSSEPSRQITLPQPTQALMDPLSVDVGQVGLK